MSTSSDSSDDYHNDRPRRPRLRTTYVTHGKFQYDGDRFYVNEERLTGDPTVLDLSLFFPQPDTDEDREFRAPFLTKKYITTQFEHYDIPYDASASRDELLKQLEDCFLEGKLDSVPPSISAIHEILRKKWLVIQQEHKADIEHYEAALDQWTKDRFNSHATLAEKASYNPGLFLAIYYLDDEGKPDRSKMPNLLIIEGHSFGIFTSGDLDAAVPGLFSAGHDFWSRRSGHREYLLLGWDADEVKQAKIELVARLEREEAELVQQGDWQRLDAHLSYLADSKVTAKPNPWPLGRYLVRCPALEMQDVEDDWDGPLPVQDGLYLTIRPANLREPSFIAVMEFKVLTGKMLLFDDKDLLNEWLGSDSDSEVDEFGLARCQGMSGEDKEGRDTKTWLARQQGKPSLPLRYYFIWKANDARGGLAVDYNDRAYGTILFEDDSFTKFGGEMDFGEFLVPGKSYFGGGKVSDSLDCVDLKDLGGMSDDW